VLVVAAVSTSSGIAAAAPLPAAAGTDPSKPPLVACYESTDPTTGNWLAVNDGYSLTAPYCGLVFSGGVWNAVMSQMRLGWSAAFVVMY
jgi:hypothetical protein